MVRTPQTPELVTLDELAAISQQLQDAARLFQDAEKLVQDREAEGLFLVYKPTLMKALEALRRGQASLYESLMATKMGKPMTQESTSPRAKRIAKAKAQVTEVRKQIKNTKNS